MTEQFVPMITNDPPTDVNDRKVPEMRKLVFPAAGAKEKELSTIGTEAVPLRVTVVEQNGIEIVALKENSTILSFTTVNVREPLDELQSPSKS